MKHVRTLNTQSLQKTVVSARHLASQHVRHPVLLEIRAAKIINKIEENQ